MSEKEMRELDAWIARKLFNRLDVEFDNGEISWDSDKPIVPRYTTDPAAAMSVWKACLNRLMSKEVHHWQGDQGENGMYYFRAGKFWGEHETIEIAICKFARQLFGKE